MPSPALALSDLPAHEIEADALVIGLLPGATAPQLAGVDDGPLLTIQAQARMLGLTGSVDETARIPAPEGVTATTVLLVGLGDAPHSDEHLRAAAGVAVRSLSGAARVALALPATTPEGVQAILEGAALGAYRYEKSSRPHSDAEPQARPSAVTHITHTGGPGAVGDAHRRAAIIVDAVALVRDLVTTPPNVLYPQTFVDRVHELVKDLPIDVEVWDETALQAEGFGGITAVGQGSARPPRLVALRYRASSTHPHLALVGKGITFDSGGLSLKPASSMVGMKYDMTGAATVLATVIAAARLDASTRVTGWLCLAENMPSGSALRPNDVITTRSGRTVEVLNTDAEGRLVLADGLAAASAEQPDTIVDVATLTGAARVALGERYAGLMGDEDAVELVRAAAERSGELVWPMPLPSEIRAKLSSDVADIANAKPGNTAGGMLLAGVFLREFVGRRGDSTDAPRIPWAHLDVAGPANNAGAAFGYTPKGASGVLTRTLIQLTESFSSK